MSAPLKTIQTKDEAYIRKEVQKMIRATILARFSKKSGVVDTALVYFPYLLETYVIHDLPHKLWKAPKAETLYSSAGFQTASAIRTFPSLEGLELQDCADDAAAIHPPDQNEVALLREKIRRNLVLKVLPKQTRSYREFDVQSVQETLFFRPVWMVRYWMLGRMHIYHEFADPYQF